MAIKGTKASPDYSGDDVADLLADPVATTPEAPASIASDGEETTEYQDTAVSSKHAKNRIKKDKKRSRKEATSTSACSLCDKDSDNDKDTDADSKKAKERTACGKKIKPGDSIFRQYRMHNACGPHVRKAIYADQKVWGKGKKMHKRMKQIKEGQGVSITRRFNSSSRASHQASFSST